MRQLLAFSRPFRLFAILAYPVIVIHSSYVVWQSVPQLLTPNSSLLTNTSKTA